MNADLRKWYRSFLGTEGSAANSALAPMEDLVRSGKRTVAFNRRIMKKTVDLSWISAIETGLVHLDTVLRNPRVTIEDIEEVVPIALSRKVTVESVKHLAQHTNLIQSVDPKTGNITPSRILNVYKEESLLTYENKFINTLVDRLYIFVTQRYEKLQAVKQNEDAYTVDYSTVAETASGGSCKVSMQIEMMDIPADSTQGGYTTWERIEKIKTAVDSYKSSQFCMKMGTAYIRPPVMRTNAIMKNVDLKACLLLWQFIESYDKVGYDIYIADSAQTPPEAYLEDLGRIAAMNFMLLGYHTGRTDSEDIRGSKTRSYSPKILRKFNFEDPAGYDVEIEDAPEPARGYVLRRDLPDDAEAMAAEIAKVIEIEQNYLQAEEKRILEEKRAAEEAERRRIMEQERRAEEQRLAAERRREKERLAEEKRRQEEQEKQLRALMEQRKREEEERLFEEQERQKQLERERAEAELRAQEEEARRIAEEQARAEQASRAAADLAAAEQQAEQLAVMEAEREALAVKKEAENAARLERERVSAERAKRLKAERRVIESKPFSVIYEEYARDPYHMAKRGVKRLLKAMGHGPDPARMTENEREILKIEEKLAEYTRAEQSEARARRDAEREERRRLDDLFDSYSSSSFRHFRLKVRTWFREHGRGKK